MAKKEPPKPLFSVKHDFVASLDNIAQQSIMLLQTISFVLEHGDLKPGLKSELQLRHDNFRDALMSRD